MKRLEKTYLVNCTSIFYSKLLKYYVMMAKIKVICRTSIYGNSRNGVKD